jgi:Fur family transcriptional regulator, ferric uptake regulator
MSCGPRLAQELRQAGFRVTPQRSIILEAVSHNAGHQTAQQVFDQARQRLPGLNLATVYRALDALHRAGLIDLLSNGSDLVRFGLHDPTHPHAHLICRSCDDILEVGPDSVQRLAAALKRSSGFSLDVGHLTLVGLCDRCSAKA